MCYLSLVLPLLIYFASLFLPHELAPFVRCPPSMAIVCWISLHLLRLSHRDPISCCAWSQTVFAFSSLFIADFLESQNSQYLIFKKIFFGEDQILCSTTKPSSQPPFLFLFFYVCVCVWWDVAIFLQNKQRKAQTNA